MTILSKQFNLNNFMDKFYLFQSKMGITTRQCFYNCRYLVEYLSQYNIKAKSVNGFVVLNEVINGNISSSKTEHNWLEIDGEIIEPNKQIFDISFSRYFRFDEINEMYKSLNSSNKEKREDLQYIRRHLLIFMSKTTGINIKYENMLWSRNVNKELCIKYIKTYQ